MEMELGGSAKANDQLFTPFALKFGLARSFEFKIQGDGLRYNGAGDGDFGFGNMSLLGKFRFRGQRGTSPALAILAGVDLPTASDSVGGGTTNLFGRLLATGGFWKMSWTANVGLRVINLGGDGIDYEVPATLALAADRIFGPVGVIMEVADFIPLSGQDNRLHLLGAVTWRIGGRLMADFAFIKGFGAAPDWEAHIGFTLNFGKMW
jgi:hypothetical protein